MSLHNPTYNPSHNPPASTPALVELARHIPPGAGLGLRPALWHDILQHPDDIDFLEIVIDDYLDLPIRDALALLRPMQERFPLVAHGVSLSVASAEGIEPEYVDRVARLLDALSIEIYSEHLSFRTAGGITLGQFVPVPFTEAWAERVATNVKQVQAITQRTLILENISYLLGHPHEALGEPAFVSAVAEIADCGLLLDVTNVLTNGANLGYGSTAYVDALPTHRILQAHIAGGHIDGELYIDSHGHAVPQAAFDLLAYTSKRSSLCAALLERDKHFSDFAALRQELNDIRKALSREPSQTKPTDAPDVSTQAMQSSSAAIAYEVLRTPPAPCQPLPDADAIPAQELQHRLALALSQPGQYRALRNANAPHSKPAQTSQGQASQGQANQANPDNAQCNEAIPGNPSAIEASAVEASSTKALFIEANAIDAYLLSFAPSDVRAFAKILQFKRRELITGLLHGTSRHLERTRRLVDLLGLYFMEAPDGGLSKLDDTLGFVAFLEAQETIAPALKALARHEATSLALRSTPYRFWHPLTRRKTILLACHPRELDKAIHGELPDLLPTPLRVCYTRKRKGIWVSC